jgi:hypothetical protein
VNLSLTRTHAAAAVELVGFWRPWMDLFIDDP